MPPLIRVKDFIEEMDAVSEETRVFLNVRTGKFVLLTSETLEAMEAADEIELNDGMDDGDEVPEWQKELMQEADEVLSDADYRELPDQFDIDEYSIMEGFCISIEDEDMGSRLLKVIQGKGAFKGFRDTVDESGLSDEWYGYREEAYRKIAREWLEGNGVAYTDEDGDRQ